MYAPLGRACDSAARYRFEEGMGVDKVFSGLVSRARKSLQLQSHHLRMVKKRIHQILEVGCKELSVMTLI